MIRDKDGQAFVPGFLEAVASTPHQPATDFPPEARLLFDVRLQGVRPEPAQRQIGCDEATADPRPRCACGRPRWARSYRTVKLGEDAYHPTCQGCAGKAQREEA